MKRTPRSASRRASRQLAAKVPGFFASGPYISSTDSGSPLRSVTSGTDGLHAKGHLVLGDARLDLRIERVLAF